MNAHFSSNETTELVGYFKGWWYVFQNLGHSSYETSKKHLYEGDNKTMKSKAARKAQPIFALPWVTGPLMCVCTYLARPPLAQPPASKQRRLAGRRQFGYYAHLIIRFPFVAA